MDQRTATTSQPEPPITAYGFPERKDPLRTGYLITHSANLQPKKPGSVFRDPTNGKVYLVAPDGSLRRATVSTNADGTATATTISRQARRHQRHTRPAQRT